MTAISEDLHTMIGKDESKRTKNDEYIKHFLILPGGVVGNMLALHAVNPGSIPGRGDT